MIYNALLQYIFSKALCWLQRWICLFYREQIVEKTKVLKHLSAQLSSFSFYRKVKRLEISQREAMCLASERDVLSPNNDSEGGDETSDTTIIARLPLQK